MPRTTPPDPRANLRDYGEPPATAHIVSYSELDTFRQCPLKHHLTYATRWRGPVKSRALTVGSLVHEVLEAYYIGIRDGEDWGPKVSELLADKTDEHAVLVKWIFDGYRDQWENTDWSEWRVLEVEYEFKVPLPEPSGRASRRLWIKGKVDLVMLHIPTSKVWIWDHKSGAQKPSQMNLEIDDQFGLYTWALRALGWPVVGSIHNYLKSAQLKGDKDGKKPSPLADRFGRTYLNRTTAELNSLAADAWAVAVNAYPPKSRQLPLYSSPDARQCGWKCDVKEAHLLMRAHPERTEEDIMTDLGYQVDNTRH